MSDISSIERRKLERLFCMGSGYVLNFSDRTFSEFFEEHTHIDIDATTYRERGTSKANRLRSFWTIEGNHVVGKVIEAMACSSNFSGGGNYHGWVFGQLGGLVWLTDGGIQKWIAFEEGGPKMHDVAPWKKAREL